MTGLRWTGYPTTISNKSIQRLNRSPKRPKGTAGIIFLTKPSLAVRSRSGRDLLPDGLQPAYENHPRLVGFLFSFFRVCLISSGDFPGFLVPLMEHEAVAQFQRFALSDFHTTVRQLFVKLLAGKRIGSE
jgi:hypothetical protein